MVDNKFLIGEVREGFYVPSQIKQAWAAELEVLGAVDKACRENGLRYFAAWGTLLGAVRHKGYIPWDDDIDIWMIREDYNKLLEIAQDVLPEGYHIQSYVNQPNHWHFIANLVGKNRICFEKDHLRAFHGFPYIACVDIFVLDYMYEDEEKEAARREKLKFIMAAADSIVAGKCDDKKIKDLLTEISRRTGRTIKPSKDLQALGVQLYALMEEIFAEVKEEDATKLTQMMPWGMKNSGFVWDKEIFEKMNYVPFEEGAISIPLEYDGILRWAYADYYKVVRGGGLHDYPFFEKQKENLKKVLDFDLPEYRFDASRLLRTQDESDCKNESYKELCLDGIAKLEGLFSEGKLPECQQMAIEIGTLIEEMRGEGSRSVAELEKFCELLYEISYMSDETDISRQNDKVKKSLDDIQRIFDEEIYKFRTVCMILSRKEEWDALKEIYLKESAKPDTEVLVVPVPYFFKDYDGSPTEEVYERENFDKSLNLVCYDKVNLKLLRPETIYTTDIFANENPALSIDKNYYSAKLKQYTDELIHVVPFTIDDFEGKDDKAYCNMNYYVKMPSVVEADYTIVQSEIIREHYIEKLVEFAGENTRNLWAERIRVR